MCEMYAVHLILMHVRMYTYPCVYTHNSKQLIKSKIGVPDSSSMVTITESGLYYWIGRDLPKVYHR